ncbi:DUF3306 domain-containing protein [Vibrio sp. 10N.222.54.F12]|uniref:DUF3306 domain-containing protein n=1 Tax=Vibrio TaxID=662 RepID=UPI000C84E78D|nr:DUF3306 domain-containing protein [Vibrio tasmaniensis]PML14364.1 hypothetical protein BCT83_16850 [Vibrio tasmaniensis]PML42765.1 hypothetical protein BCT76_21695 [Vibrio tasmaniensis]
MATNFFSRWSQRKLDESTDEPLEVEQTLEVPALTPSDSSTSEISPADLSSEMEAAAPQSLESETIEINEEVHVADVQDPAPEATEDLSVAQLLVSEASESVKKAALRKLFLSEEFNVRDGLDDYDDDYSNLKSLSEGVAETLRDWVKDKTEEDTVNEPEQVADNEEETLIDEVDDSINEAEETESEFSESDEIAGEEKKLYKKTVSDNNATMPDEADLKEMGQNIPHK